MKNMLAFLLVTIPLFIFAQDDYCSCMDEYQFQVNVHDSNILNVITEATSDLEFLTIFTSNPDFEIEQATEITLDEYNPFPINQKPLHINVSPRNADRINEIEEDTKVIVKGSTIYQTTKAQQKTRMAASSSNGKSRIKKSKKMFSKRAKRKPKAKKYKGKCPSF